MSRPPIKLKTVGRTYGTASHGTRQGLKTHGGKNELQVCVFLRYVSVVLCAWLVGCWVTYLGSNNPYNEIPRRGHGASTRCEGGDQL